MAETSAQPALKVTGPNGRPGDPEEQASSQAPPKLPSTPVSWRSLPRKDQLSILTLARLAEPLSQTSLQAYMFFMLRSFNPTLTDAQVSYQAGWLTGSFTAMQCLTAVFWGRLADKEWFGRKNVLLVSLIGTFFSTVGFGFSASFASAMFFRCLSGALNGNIGVMRTMISEIIKEKKFQPKAFLILPVTFNFGVLVGPLLGGWLQNPVQLYPHVFGPGSRFGGENGVQWMIKYPYAFPNVLSAGLFLFSAALVLFGLEETLSDRAGRPDFGTKLGWSIGSFFKRLIIRPLSYYKYTPITTTASTDEIELSVKRRSTEGRSKSPAAAPRPRPKLPYRRIFTPNVLFTLLTHGLMHCHTSAFNNLWFLFLSTPRFDPAHPDPPSHKHQRLPFYFTGGLGLDPPTIGLAIGLIGLIGLTLQFGIYPYVTHSLGVLKTFRLALLYSFPFVYLFIPYLALIPTNSGPPAAVDGFPIWITICLFLFVQVMGRTFVLPISVILVNNATPHPSVLGAMHGVGQSVTSGCRTLGPIIWSGLYGLGLQKGIVGISWWALFVVSLITAWASMFQREGDGHEIWLEGD